MDSNNCSVTIMNISSGPLHTWLVFEPEVYFSFDSENIRSAITCDNTGKLETIENTKQRKYDEKKTFRISEQQFDKMLKKISELSTGATYALIPLREHEYNCVKASQEVLKSGGIDFLNDVVTPMGVSRKINGDPSYKDVDAQVSTYGLLPRASAAIVNGAGLSLDQDMGWVVGGALAAGAAFCLYKMQKK